MILIRHKGETLLVGSVDGYPGCKVLAENVPHPPHDCCRWEGGAWVDCPKLEAQAKAKRLARAKANLGPEIMDELVAETLRRLKGS